MSEANTSDHVAEVKASRSRLPRIYAEALMRAAGSQTEEIGQELRSVVTDLFQSDPRVEAYLSSPAISKRTKQPVLENAFRGQMSQLLNNLIGVLNQNRRLDLLRSIQITYQALLDEKAGRMRVKVRSAAPLTDDQKQRLVQTLADKYGQQPVLDVRVEPELLGGLVVQVGDRIYDTSVRTRIDALRTQLMAQGTSYVANKN